MCGEFGACTYAMLALAVFLSVLSFAFALFIAFTPVRKVEAPAKKRGGRPRKPVQESPAE